MLLTSFPAGPLQANCYVVAREPGAGCVLVDPGMDAMDGVRAVVAKAELTPGAVLLTHGHFDHVWSAHEVAAEYGCPVWIHPADRHLLADPMAALSGGAGDALSQQLGLDTTDFTEPPDVRDAVDGTVVEVDGMAFTVDHVPGHTAGTVVYRVPYVGPQPFSQLVFSGDFLFQGSIGRTDLGGGSHDDMMASLRSWILPLADDVVVLPGHGPQTSIGRERATNPFVADLSA